MLLVSFAHLKEKSILKQWKNLKAHYSIMTRMIKDVLSAFSFDVANERLFSIVSRIYDFHKSYHSDIIRTKMIIRQYDYKKAELKFLNLDQSNLKEEEICSKKEIEKEIKIRNQVLQDEEKNYINDVNESASIVKQSYIHFANSRD